MRTIRFSLNGFQASVALPDKFFDEHDVPKWNLLNSSFSNTPLQWVVPIGKVPKDEDVVFQPTQSIPIADELKKLREVVQSLEKKCDGVR